MYRMKAVLIIIILLLDNYITLTLIRIRYEMETALSLKKRIFWKAVNMKVIDFEFQTVMLQLQFTIYLLLKSLQ